MAADHHERFFDAAADGARARPRSSSRGRAGARLAARPTRRRRSWRRSPPAATSAGSSVSSGLVEPGSSPSHIGIPIRTTAAALTALVSTKMSTVRLAIRSTEKPLLRSTHAPSASPARPLTETTELTASSDSDRRVSRARARGVRRRGRTARCSRPHESSSKPIPARTHGIFASEICSCGGAQPGHRQQQRDDEREEDRQADDAVAQRPRGVGHRVAAAARRRLAIVLALILVDPRHRLHPGSNAALRVPVTLAS